jgi:ADP-ribose pyrophosphatase
MKKNNTSDNLLIWKEKSRHELLKTVVMTITETESISPDGKTGNYIVMDAKNWVIVIPVRGNKFLMVKQWRHGERALSIEFPGGVIETDEKPEKAAARELKEETGCTAGHLTLLGSMNPNPALMSNHVFVYVAENLSEATKQQLDNDEYIQPLELPQDEVLGSMGTKAFPHALMAAAATLYMNYQKKKQI